MRYTRTIPYAATTMSNTVQRKKAAQKRSALNVRRLHRFVLLGGKEAWRNRLGREQTAICSNRGSMLEALGQSSQESVWISPTPERTEELLQAIVAFRACRRGGRGSFGSLFMLESPRARILPSLHGCFGTVIGEVPSFKTLPIEQLVEVLSAPAEKSRDVFVGGIV